MKTKEIRARELFKLVYGFEPDFNLDEPLHSGWIKLGKFVLSLERKWTSVKRGKSK